MAVTIKSNSESIKYTFPPKTGFYGGFAMEEESVRQRVTVAERLYSHGGAIIADGKVSSRTIELNGVIQTIGAGAAAALEAELDVMKYQCSYGDTFNTERRLYLPQYSGNKYYILGGMANFAIERLSSIGAQLQISWVVPDPFLYARNSDRQTWSYQITIPASGRVTKRVQITAGRVGGVSCYPVCPYSVDVTVTSGTMNYLKFRNLTDSSRVVLFRQAMSASSNDRIVLDYTNGTATGYGGMWSGGVDVIKHLDRAEWWRIIPYGNHFAIGVTGAAGSVIDIEMKWRPRWL